MDAWTALGDPTRRTIFEHLAERPRAVGELARELPVSRPAVSQHLKVLKAARRSVTVNATPERAFEVFTAGFGTWWPIASHHIGEQDAVEVVLEARSGGRWFERAADGTECDWGFVTACEPPSRLLLAWHLTPEWTYDPDPSKATEVEVTFTPEGDETLIRLTHRRLPSRTVPLHRGGWEHYLPRLAAVAAGDDPGPDPWQVEPVTA